MVTSVLRVLLISSYQFVGNEVGIFESWEDHHRKLDAVR